MTTRTPVKNELRDYLADDDVMRMLRTIDRINPSYLPSDRVSTIKEVADVMDLPLKIVWKMCDKGVELGILMYYSGMLSRKRVDLTDFGEDIVDADGTEDLRNIIRRGAE